MDTIIDAPDDPKSGWAMLESEASGGWSMRAFAHLVYGLRKVCLCTGVLHTRKWTCLPLASPLFSLLSSFVTCVQQSWDVAPGGTSLSVPGVQ